MDLLYLKVANYYLLGLWERFAIMFWESEVSLLRIKRTFIYLCGTILVKHFKGSFLLCLEQKTHLGCYHLGSKTLQYSWVTKRKLPQRKRLFDLFQNSFCWDPELSWHLTESRSSLLTGWLSVPHLVRNVIILQELTPAQRAVLRSKGAVSSQTIRAQVS